MSYAGAMETVEVGLGRPPSVQTRRALPPLATALASADEVLVLEGGDVPELAGVLGRLDADDPETASLGGFGAGGLGGLGLVVPTFTADVAGLRQRGQTLRAVVTKRRAALARAHTERTELMRRVAMLDQLIADVMVPKRRKAAAAGDQREVRRLDDELDRLDMARGVAAARAVRYAKTEALGQVLTRTARTQANLVELIVRARARGDRVAETELRRGFGQIATETGRLKQLRRTQVETWKHRTTAGRLAMARVMRETTERELARVEGAPRSPVTADRAERRASELRVRIAKLRQVEAQAQARLPASATAASAAQLARGLSPADQGEVLAGLDGLFGSIKKWAKKTGGALSGGVRKVGGAVKAATRTIGRAGARLAKKAACKVASNPKVLGAAAAAAGSAIGGPAGGIAAAAASKTGAALLAGACGRKSPPFQAQAHAETADDASFAPAPAARSSVTPIVIGGAAAAAAVALLAVL